MNTLIITMFIAVIVIGVALLVVITATRRSARGLDQEKYRTRWLTIAQNVGATTDSWQFAILSADKLLDSALRDRGISGTTLGERLKNAKPHLSNIDGVWRAHKLRNQIAHEDAVSVSRRQASEALKIFKQALSDLGAL